MLNGAVSDVVAAEIGLVAVGVVEAVDVDVVEEGAAVVVVDVAVGWGGVQGPQ